MGEVINDYRITFWWHWKTKQKSEVPFEFKNEIDNNKLSSSY